MQWRLQSPLKSCGGSSFKLLGEKPCLVNILNDTHAWTSMSIPFGRFTFGS
jgi:hypothetical protein